MRRLVAILLISLIGFQTSWATVTSYCQHEQGAAARHVGHHEHQHLHKSLINAVDQDDHQSHQQNLSGTSVDLDCSFCHAAGIVALLPDLDPAVTIQATLDVSYRLILHPSSAPHDLPERPNWS